MSKSFPSLIRWLGKVIVIAVIYFLTARMGLTLAFEQTNATPIWPPSGIGFAALLLFGPRVWPSILIGAFLANTIVFTINHTADFTTIMIVSFYIGIGNSLEAIFGNFMLHRFIGYHNPLDRTYDVCKFVLVAVIMCLVPAVIGPNILCISGMVPWALYQTTSLTWWIGDVTGILIFTPILLTWYRDKFTPLTILRRIELGFFLVAVFITNLAIFGGYSRFSFLHYPLTHLFIPLIVWAAFRFGRNGVMASILIISGIAIWGTINGFGPFVGGTLNESLLLLQEFISVVTITGLILTAVLTERKKVEEVLYQSRNELSDFFENAPVGFHQAGPNGIIQWVNRAELKLLGYSREEYIGHPVKNFYVDEERFQDLNERLWNGQTVHDYEVRLRCKDGSVRYVLISSNVLWEGGKFIHTRCFTRDITEHKLAEAALKKSEERFQEIYHSSKDAVGYVNPDGVLIDVNQAFSQLTGYSREELLSGKKFQDLTPPEYHDMERQKIKEVLKTGKPVEYEKEYIRKDGLRVPILLTTFLVKDVDGNPEGVAAIIKDITEQKRAQEEKFRLAGIVDSSYDAIIGKTLGGIITAWNRGAQRLYGYKVEEVIGKSVSILMPAERSDELLAILQKLVKGEAVEQFETVRVRKDGRQIDVSLTVSPIKNANGKIIGASAIARDITERKQAEKQMQEAIKIKSEFTSTVSHELRTPLAISKEALSLILRGKLGQVTAQQKEILTTASNNIDRLSLLINDVLDFSKIEAGQMKIYRELVDVTALVKESYEGWKLRANLKKIDFGLELPSKPIKLMLDKLRFIQILSNLLNNAIKFTPENGKVQLVLEETPQDVKFSVVDTGAGISQEDLPKIFGKFQQLNRTHGPGYQGTGLGLNITKSLVELHGGQLTVESEEAKGSKFMFNIPKSVKMENKEVAGHVA